MKILLITYWFPPAGVIGAKRWGEFYDLSLKDEALDITVVTANWANHQHDNKIHYIGEEVEQKPFFSLNKKISSFSLLRHPSLMIRSLDSSLLANWYKDTKIWMDKNIHNDFDVVISSFGPISSVLLGNQIKKKYNIPHIVDLRDLVSLQGQKNRVPLIHFLDKAIDKFIMRKVDSFLVVSPTGNDSAIKFYNKKVDTIYNGLSCKIQEDDVDLSIKNKYNINILYMGTLGINRNPSKILMILNNYVKENPSCRICVKFASQDDPLNFIEKEKITHIKLSWLGYLNKEVLEEEQTHSDAYLVLEDLTPKGNENLTGKIFEYLNSKKPIIASCHKNSDIIKLLKETNAGSLVETVDDFKIFVEKERYLFVKKCNYYTRENQYMLLKKVIGDYNV